MAIQNFDVLVESAPDLKTIDEQVCSMFDAPLSAKLTERFVGQCPDWDEDFSIGLIVGPSGSGKSTVSRHVFGSEYKKDWKHNSSVVSQFPGMRVDEITSVFSSVGFNTIPSWIKPRSVLSNGEGFRVDLAAALLESNRVMIDEFTSVVDRQVAEIACYSVAKYVRKSQKKLVAVTCHYDVIDWLQPDWVLDMATRQMTRRLLRRREPKPLAIHKISREYWGRFSRYHYMSADLATSAQCYGSFLGNNLVGFHALIHMPVSSGIKQSAIFVSRTVVDPDYQGLGINKNAINLLGSCLYKYGHRLRMPPAHPSLVRSYSKDDNWRLVKAPGCRNTHRSESSSVKNKARPCAVFEYVGQKFEDAGLARDLLSWPAMTKS